MRILLFILLVFTNQFVQCQQTDERIITAFGQYLTTDSSGVLTLHYDESIGWEDYQNNGMNSHIGYAYYASDLAQLNDPLGRPMIYADYSSYWSFFIRDAMTHEIIFGKQGELQRLDSVIPAGNWGYGYEDTAVYWQYVRTSQRTGGPLPPYRVQCAVGDPNSYSDLTDSGYYVGHSICSHHPDKRHGVIEFRENTPPHEMRVIESYNQVIFPWPNENETYGLIDLALCDSKDPYYFIRLMKFRYDPYTKTISFNPSTQYFPFTPYCLSHQANSRYPFGSGMLKKGSGLHFNLTSHANGQNLWLSYGFLDTVYCHLIDHEGIGPVQKHIIPIRDSFERGFAKVHRYPVWDAFTPNATKTDKTRPFFTYSRGQGRNMSCTYFVSQIGWDKPYPGDLSILCNAHLNNENGRFSFSFMTDTVKAFCRTHAVLQPIAYSANDSILYVHKNFNYEDTPSYWQWHWQDNKRYLLGSAPNRDRLIFPYRSDYNTYQIIEPWLSPSSELLFSLGHYIHYSTDDRSLNIFSKILQKDIAANYAFIANSNLFGNDLAIEELNNMDPSKKFRIKNPEKEKEFLCSSDYEFLINDNYPDSCQRRWLPSSYRTELPVTRYPNIWGLQYFADFRISIDTQACYNEITFSNASIGPHYEAFVWILSNGDTFNTMSLSEKIRIQELKAGNYKMTLKARDKYNRWRSKSYSFSIPAYASRPNAFFTVNDSIFCQYDTLVLKPIAGWKANTNQLHYQWIPEAGLKIDSIYHSNEDAQALRHPLTSAGQINPQLIIGDGHCRDTFTWDKTIHVLPSARADFQISDSMLCVPADITLKPTYKDEVDSLLWSIPRLGSQSVSVNYNPQTFSLGRNTGSGTYQVFLKTFISSGCNRSDSLQIAIKPGLPEGYAPYLRYVSYSEDNKTIELKWTGHDESPKSLIFLNRSIFKEVHENQHSFASEQLDKNEIFSIVSIDHCGQPSKESNTAKLILLETEESTEEIAYIIWSPYQWPEGVNNYLLEQEIADQYRVVASFDSSILSAEITNFKELNKARSCFRIRAQSLNTFEDKSISNTVCVPQKTVIFIPNAFSPDGDGLNDVWKPVTAGAEWVHLRIYDRWGGLLYDEKALSPEWDGQNAQAGMYAYTLEVRSAKGESFFRNGSVQLVR